MILLIDNFDSFSYNLYQLAGKVDPDIKVVRNNKISVSEIISLKPKRIIISPGPGRSENAGICVELCRTVRNIPVLGVCLGHQSIGIAFGAAVTYAKQIMHGKQSEIKIDTSAHIFRGLEPVIKVARYHSLAIDDASLPKELVETARSETGEIMAISHKTLPIYGVQFHPESILTPRGETIIRNFIN